MKNSKRIVVFGAGEAGRRTLAALKSDERVVAIVDNDRSKAGHSFLGHNIIAPDTLHKLEYDQILVASMHWREILEQLESLGCLPDRIVVAPASRAAPATASASAASNVVFGAWNSWSVAVLQSVQVEALVSVIMPTFNRGEGLSRAVASVLGQSYRRFELIVVDDGSTDDTMSVLNDLAETDERIRVVSRQHGGVSVARNAGLSEARGSLIAYLDSDNRWHPDYLRYMVAGFQDPCWKTGYAGMNVFDECGGQFRTRLEPFDYETLKRRNLIDLNVFMHRRELIDECGDFNQDMTRLVDWDLILRYTRRYPPFVLPCMLADYFVSKHVRRISDVEPFQGNIERMSEYVSPRSGIRRTPGAMRVAYVQHEFPALSQTFVQNEADFLHKLGVRVSVFHARESAVSGVVPEGIEVRKYASRDELVHLLASRDIDLVHTHFAMPHPADYIVPVCERLDLPFTMKPHAFDIFRNDLDPRHHVRHTGGHRLCRRVYCEGAYHQRFLKAAGVPLDKLMVVRNIFDLQAYRRHEIRMAGRVRHIVAISRFVEKKGFHVLIEAFRKLEISDCRLDLYGYGEELSRLEALAQGDSRIALHDGPRSPSEAIPMLERADLFALPCIEDRYGDTDGLPTVLMEAMAFGVPVLTTSLASIPDLVRHRETGFIVESGSVDALVRGLEEVVESSSDERERIVRAARSRLDAEFDPVRNARALLTDWQEILGLL